MNILGNINKIISENGRFRGTLLFVYWVIHKVSEHLYISMIKVIFPVDKNVILFNSEPDYSDNARALAEYMSKNGYGLKFHLYFDVSNECKYSVSDIRFVSVRGKYGIFRFKYLKTVYTAGYIMCTHETIITRKMARHNQHLIRLWHGCGYKDKSKYDGGERNFDYALVPGKLFVKTKAYFWNVDKKYILPLGYPRYDWLIRCDLSAKSLIDSFKIDCMTKVVIWMPTYRNDRKGKYNESSSIKSFPIVKTNTEWSDLNLLCKLKNVVILVKLHPLQKEYGISFDTFSNIKEITNNNFDVVNVPLYKFISLTDALISDYSSVAVDDLLVNRPMAFTLDDYEQYNMTRGFVFEDPIKYMPGHHVYDFEELKEFIVDVANGKDRYVQDRKRMLDISIRQSENYCKDILDRIGISLKM